VAGRDFSRHPAAVLRRRRVIGGSPPGGFEGQLYGRALDVVFLTRLRDQTTFVSVDELVTQIGRDVEKTQQIFDSESLDEAILLT